MAEFSKEFKKNILNLLINWHSSINLSDFIAKNKIYLCLMSIECYSISEECNSFDLWQLMLILLRP